MTVGDLISHPARQHKFIHANEAAFRIPSQGKNPPAVSLVQMATGWEGWGFKPVLKKNWVLPLF
jgi:hypothetical protein